MLLVLEQDAEIRVLNADAVSHGGNERLDPRLFLFSLPHRFPQRFIGMPALFGKTTDEDKEQRGGRAT
jgi:hypothetical protein